jgi:hypothetical protein
LTLSLNVWMFNPRAFRLYKTFGLVVAFDPKVIKCAAYGININDMYKMTVGREGVRGYEAHEVK